MKLKNWICAGLLCAFGASFLSPAAKASDLPPGNSSVDQYTEGLPTLGGEIPALAASSKAPGSSKSASTAPNAQSPSQASQHFDGAAAAAAILAHNTTSNPAGSTARDDAGTTSGDSHGKGVAAIPGEDASTATGLISGGIAGMGFALPLILVLTSVFAVAFVVARHRSDSA